MYDCNPGMTFRDKKRYLSLLYKNLTPDERSRWEDRARYDTCMLSYTPPPGYDAWGYLTDEWRGPEGGARQRAGVPAERVYVFRD